MAEFSTLTGKLLLATLVDQNTDEIVFITLDGRAYRMYHPQDCCETVTIDDICGELDALVAEADAAGDEETALAVLEIKHLAHAAWVRLDRKQRGE